jgi:lipid A 3-O-deacylase
MDRTRILRVGGWCLFVLLVLASAIAPAGAQSSVVDEVKVGVLAHDIGFLGDSVEGGADLMGEILFKSPDLLSVIGSPRPAVGLSVNTAGDTSYAYADLSWTARLWHPADNPETGPYVIGAAGGAVHDGRLDTSGDGEKALGSRALFHLAVGLGYQLTRVVSVETYFDHLSNADLSSHNAGLNNVGLRMGFRF